MRGQQLPKEGGDGDHTTLVGLRGPEVHGAAHLGEGLHYLDARAHQVEASPPEPGRLPPADASVGQQVYEGAVGRPDGLGERGDLGGGEEVYLPAPRPRQPDTDAGGLGNEAGLDG
jgi:hypothetical protein